MKEEIINIAFLPGGAGNAINAIKIYSTFDNVRTYALDSDENSAGLKLANCGLLVPKFDDERFLEELIKIIKNNNINILLPNLDESESFLSDNYFELSKLTGIIISPPETIKITRDKWLTWSYLNNFIPMLRSYINIKDIARDYPLIIKPRVSSGSKNVFKLEDDADLEYYFNKLENPIVQEYLDGKEYTVDCFSVDGNLIFAVPRLRIRAKDGIVTIARIEYNKTLENIAHIIASRLKFNGPFFFQAKESVTSNLKVTEIGARMSGGMILSYYAGADIYTSILKLYKNEIITKPIIDYGLMMTRYWEEYYYHEA